jgi:hypothetical protein
VNESECDPSIQVAQEFMVAAEALTVCTDLPLKALRSFAIMMDVHLNIGDSLASHRRQGGKKLSSIFFLRVEECVTRSLTLYVSRRIVCDARPCLPPPPYSVACSFERDPTSKRLIVIGDGKPETLGSAGPGKLAHAASQIPRKPSVCVTG